MELPPQATITALGVFPTLCDLTCVDVRTMAVGQSLAPISEAVDELAEESRVSGSMVSHRIESHDLGHITC